MKLPKLPKFKLPTWTFNLKFPKLFFQKKDSKRSFYFAWKKFLRQIPAESRPIINSYQHFIVLGTAKSGKTDLTQGLIEQSQDLYPFDTSYTALPEVQFYLGPNQVIQEISFSALEDRTIGIRKKIIHLWKKLYVRRDPIILIVYNCFASEHQNLRELNKLAQLIAGKISLLSEITKKPLQIRIVLTNQDRTPGYLEFARFLKQQNLSFNINLSSNFESNTLADALKDFYEQHLSLMLTTTSNHDFSKILLFSKEMPLLFPTIEEFLRALVARVSFSGSLKLDSLAFTSNQETSTSFIPFQWNKLPAMEIFFRHPMLKHQIASACLFLFFTSLLLNVYFQQRSGLVWAQKGIDQLDLLQFKAFQEEIIPSYVSFIDKSSNPALAYAKPDFFGKKLQITQNNLASRIRKHFIEREFRKAVLENKGELKCLYFLGLMHTSRNSNLGKFMLKNSDTVASSLNIDEKLLIAYVNSCSQADHGNSLCNLSKVNPFLMLTSMSPWISYLQNIQGISSQPIFMDHNFDEMIIETDKLLTAIDRLKSDPLAFGIAALLDEEMGSGKSAENIRVIRWVGENLHGLENLLLFIKNTSSLPLNTEELNIAQFFAKIKNITALGEAENQTYNFALENYLFTFQTKSWMDLVISHNVERAIQNYIVSNNDTGGAIFFKNTAETPDPSLPIFNGPFPLFKSKISIPGRYSRLEYENKVRSTAEKLTHLIDSLAINPEEKRRFTTFLAQEVISYMKRYQDQYTKFFDSCDIATVTMDELKSILRDLTAPGSSFNEFLHTVQYHTGAFSDPVLSLKNMGKLNEFDFLNTILTHNNGEAPIGEYQKILVELLQELEADSSHELYREFHPTFIPYLTPATIASLHILKKDPQSYLNKVTECLTSLKIPEKYHSPFLKPILQLHRIGQQDLKKAIEQVWSAQFYPQLESLITKFPFDPNANEAASIEEIQRILNPNGEFYKAMNQVMSAYCTKTDLHSVHLDENIYTLLNRVQNLSELLWDKDGLPQPISLNIKSVPFSQGFEDNPILVLSYLVIGNDAIRNLNQKPAWQTIKVEWWKENSCSIGVELMNKYTNSKSYKNTQKVNSLWCFFELLKEATQEGPDTWSWNLANQEGSEKYKVSLCFDTNPRSLLQIPPLPESLLQLSTNLR